MALAPCRECGREISSKAATCPHCGVNDPTGARVKRLLGVLGVSAVAIALFGIASTATNRRHEQAAEQAKAERVQAAAAAAAAELRGAFMEHRQEVLDSIRGFSDARDFANARRLLAQYRSLGDSGLSALGDSVAEVSILAELKTVPAANAAKNAALYGQLVALRPGVARYKERQEYYAAIVRDAQAKAAARRAFLGPKPVQSAWDGSYPEVKEYLRIVANDPSSIKFESCTPVYEVDAGWLVGCVYRGKNAFGGLIKTGNWFTIRQGKVIRMQDADAYKF